MKQAIFILVIFLGVTTCQTSLELEECIKTLEPFSDLLRKVNVDNSYDEKKKEKIYTNLLKDLKSQSNLFFKKCDSRTLDSITEEAKTLRLPIGQGSCVSYLYKILKFINNLNQINQLDPRKLKAVKKVLVEYAATVQETCYYAEY